MTFEDAYFIMHGSALKDLRVELDNIVGESVAKGMLFRYGFRCGESLARSIEMRTSQTRIAKVLPEVWAEVGLGRIKVKRVKGGITATLEDAIEARANGAKGRASCDFTRGYLAGLASELTGCSYYCTEDRCASKGDDYCTYTLTREV